MKTYNAVFFNELSKYYCIHTFFCAYISVCEGFVQHHSKVFVLIYFISMLKCKVESFIGIVWQ